jgi:isopenicillin N synthase-like dioxygenase
MPIAKPEQKLNIPIVDISSLVSPNSSPEAVKETNEAIGKACREWGFFYIVGHGVKASFIEKVQALSREFFRKPKEFKQMVARSEVGTMRDP